MPLNCSCFSYITDLKTQHQAAIKTLQLHSQQCLDDTLQCLNCVVLGYFYTTLPLGTPSEIAIPLHFVGMCVLLGLFGLLPGSKTYLEIHAY